MPQQMIVTSYDKKDLAKPVEPGVTVYENIASDKVSINPDPVQVTRDLESGKEKNIIYSNNYVPGNQDLLNPEVTTYSKSVYHANNLFGANEIKSNLHTKTFRFGYLNLYRSLNNAKEFLFFTKPDLHIAAMDDNGLVINNDQGGMNPSLYNIPFWRELYNSRKDTTILSLQLSLDLNDPFNHLLQNQVTSNLEIPGITSESIDTAANAYGVNYSYRGTSEASDDNPSFSLEFKDNKYLDTFMFFKAYEEYETLKHHGTIAPCKKYILKRILHDQFAIYKFIVDDDMETILYYGKMFGVYPTSLPRDVFGQPTFSDGLSYSIDFKAAFYEDMKPEIIADFNELSKPLYAAQKYQINIYDQAAGGTDFRPATAAYIVRDTTSMRALSSSSGYIYKLKWRGSDSI